MNVHFQFEFCPEHLIEGSKHKKRSQPNRFLFNIVLIAIAIWLLWTSAIHFNDENWVLTIFMSAIALIILFREQIEHFRVKERHRKSPLCNEIIDVVLSEKGVESKSSEGKTISTWEEYSSAPVFDLGVLLCRPNESYTWLPFETQKTGYSPEQITNLVNERMSVVVPGTGLKDAQNTTREV